MRKSVPIYFLVRPGKEDLGSTVMRASQMIEILKKYGDDRIDPQIMPIPLERRFAGFREAWAMTRPKNAIYFATKAAVRKMQTSAFEILRWRARSVWFDHVDEPVERMKLQGADVHLACSYEQLDVLNRMKASRSDMSGTVKLLMHNPDIRLEGCRQAQQDEFSSVYIGARDNISIPSALERDIEIVSPKSGPEMSQAIANGWRHNFHYNYRQERAGHEGAIKPFVKGFVAAGLGANIITQKSTVDAVRFLGEDYPYFVDNNQSQEDVFARARDEFGSPEWNMARSRMLDMWHTVQPQRIAGQLLSLVDECMS